MNLFMRYSNFYYTLPHYLDKHDYCFGDNSLNKELSKSTSKRFRAYLVSFSC